MRVQDLVKVSQIGIFNIINSSGNPICSITSSDISNNNANYIQYKDKLIKYITVPASQAISALNIEIKPDRKKKQAQEEAKATIGVISNTTPITVNVNAENVK